MDYQTLHTAVVKITLKGKKNTKGAEVWDVEKLH